MALIRSEHAHDQAIEASKDAVKSAEVSLEESRARLEKRERSQYHEEQIWSDTIRRNSTWVTFGLMGFNIVLLFVSIIGVEPWRRKRLVKEIETILEIDRVERHELAERLQSTIDVIASPEGLVNGVIPAEDHILEEILIEKVAVEPSSFVVFSWTSFLNQIQNPFGPQAVSIVRSELTLLVVPVFILGSAIGCGIMYIIK
jgi:sensitive to high expression protein 9